MSKRWQPAAFDPLAGEAYVSSRTWLPRFYLEARERYRLNSFLILNEFSCGAPAAHLPKRF